MTTNKATVSASSTQAIIPDCCMCGDSGLSHELFQCKVCQFRSQHRYCSNLYPKAEYFRICNWCLSEKDNNKSQNSSNSLSSTKTSSEGDIIKSKKRSNIQGGWKGRNGNSPLKPTGPIKKVQRLPERSSSSPEKLRKRIITNKALEEKLMMRRTRSADLLNNNNGITKKHVFRNKVRRYKLLEEVSSL